MLLQRSFTIYLLIIKILTHAQTLRSLSVEVGESVMIFAPIKVMPLLVPSCQKPLRLYSVTSSNLHILVLQLWVLINGSHGSSSSDITSLAFVIFSCKFGQMRSFRWPTEFPKVTSCLQCMSRRRYHQKSRRRTSRPDSRSNFNLIPVITPVVRIYFRPTGRHHSLSCRTWCYRLRCLWYRCWWQRSWQSYCFPLSSLPYRSSSQGALQWWQTCGQVQGCRWPSPLGFTL